MQKFNLGALALVTILAACGGGGGGGGGTPIPNPTTKPVRNVSISFTSVGRTTMARRAQASCPTSSVSAPTVVQAEANWNPPAGTNWGAIDGNLASATEYDTSCNVVSSSPTFTVSDATLLTTTVPSWTGPIPSPSPGQQYVFGLNPGLATVTATFPDGSSGTAPVHVYGEMGVGCAPTYYLGANGNVTRGWLDTSGQVTAVDACGYSGSNNGPMDMQMDASGHNVLIPGGYDILESASPTNIITVDDLAGVTSCTSFTSQGTTLNLSSLPPSFLMIFKTQDGKCVKFYSEQIQTNSLVGLYFVSDSALSFSD